MNQLQPNTIKNRFLKLPLLIIIGIIGSLIFYIIIPSVLERDLAFEQPIMFEWITYNLPNSNFSVSLPTNPKIESYSVPINNEKMIIDTYTVKIKDKYWFSIMISDLPQSLLINNSKIVLLDSLDGMVKSHQDNELKNYKIFVLEGLPAVRFFIRGKTTSYWNRGVVVINGNRKYILQFYNKGFFDEEIYNRFINSFKIHERKI